LLLNNLAVSAVTIEMGKKKGLPVKYTVGTKIGNPCA